MEGKIIVPDDKTEERFSVIFFCCFDYFNQWFILANKNANSSSFINLAWINYIALIIIQIKVFWLFREPLIVNIYRDLFLCRFHIRIFLFDTLNVKFGLSKIK